MPASPQSSHGPSAARDPAPLLALIDALVGELQPGARRQATLDS